MTLIETHGLVDLHSRILPGWRGEHPTHDQALNMARSAAQHGVSVLVATPRVRSLEDACDRGLAIPQLVRWFQDEIESLGIPVTVLPGAELGARSYVSEALSRLAPVTLAGTGKYVLLEASHGRFASLVAVAERLGADGFTVILGNPERSKEVQAKPAIVSAVVESGALVQIAAASLAAPTNASEWSAASMLLVMGAVHFISTGGRLSDTDYGYMAEAVRVASQIVGKEQALRLVTDNPARVLRGEPVVERPTESPEDIPARSEETQQA